MSLKVENITTRLHLNPPAMASRKFKVPGRGPAPLGRPLKDQGGRVQVVVTDEGDMLTKSDKTLKENKKKRTISPKVCPTMKHCHTDIQSSEGFPT